LARSTKAPPEREGQAWDAGLAADGWITGAFPLVVSLRRLQLDTFCHRASCAKGLLNTGEVLASVRDPRRWCAAALT
jgi:hypothetical protein